MMHVNIRHKCLYFILARFCYQQSLRLSNLKEVHMFSQLCFKCNSVIILPTVLICPAVFLAVNWKKKWFKKSIAIRHYLIWNFGYQQLWINRYIYIKKGGLPRVNSPLSLWVPVVFLVSSLFIFSPTSHPSSPYWSIVDMQYYINFSCMI